MSSTVSELMERARAARRAGDRPAALAGFQAAVAANPGNPAFRVEMAEELHMLGRLDEAEAAYRDVLARKPGQGQALRGLAICARKRGDRAAALEHFQAASAAEPDNSWSLLGMAEELHMLGRLDEAEAAYRDVLALKPGQGQALSGLAICARKRGDRAGALEHFRAAVVVAPDNILFRLEMAEELHVLGRVVEAAGVFRDVLTRQPGQGQALRGLAICARKRGDRAAALEHFQAASAAEPDNFWFLFGMAEELQALGRLDEAEATYHAVLARRPDNVQALLALGRCARLRGDRLAQFAHVQRAVRVAPCEVEPLLQLARCHLDANELAAAAQTLESLPATCRETVGLLQVRAEVERRAGRMASAWRYLQAASSCDPTHVWAVMALAAEEWRRGNPATCEALLRDAVARFPDLTEPMRELCNHLIRTKQHEACETLLERLRHSGAVPSVVCMLESQLAQSVAGRSAALAVLEEAAATLPEEKALLQRAIVLRREVGDLHGMKQAADAARPLAATHFPLWSAVVRADLHLGRLADVDASLDTAPAFAPHEQADVLELRGMLAESRFRIAEAGTWYRAALDLNPMMPGVWYRLARTGLMGGDTATMSTALERLTAIERSSKMARGESLSPSQSLLGQLLNECLLDAGLRDTNLALRTLAPMMRLPASVRLVKENPDSTFLALAHVVTLREAGLIGVPNTTSRPGAVPRVLCLYWSDSPAPEEIRATMETWRVHNPGFEHVLFDDARAAEYLAQTGSVEVLRAFRAAPEPAQRSDLFRLAWLARNGGFYVDADDRCVAPLASALDLGAELILHQEDIGSIGNNFIGCAPGHPLIRRALAMATEATNRGDAEMIWLSTGPGMLTRCFAAHYDAESPADLRDQLAGVRVLGLPELPAFIAMHCQLDYKLSGRSWLNKAFGVRRPPVQANAAQRAHISLSLTPAPPA